MFILLFFKSFPTAMHSLRVAMVSYKFSRILKHNIFSSFFIFLNGLYHDAGKLLIPNKILHKQGELTKEERIIIETHTTNFVARMIGLFFPSTKEHHLNFDGNGYGLGKKQSKVAQIIEIADVFDAVEGYFRTYKEPVSFPEAVVITNRIQDKFNPFFYEIFREDIEKFVCPGWYRKAEGRWRERKKNV